VQWLRIPNIFTTSMKSGLVAGLLRKQGKKYEVAGCGAFGFLAFAFLVCFWLS